VLALTVIAVMGVGYILLTQPLNPIPIWPLWIMLGICVACYGGYIGTSLVSEDNKYKADQYSGISKSINALGIFKLNDKQSVHIGESSFDEQPKLAYEIN